LRQSTISGVTPDFVLPLAEEYDVPAEAFLPNLMTVDALKLSKRSNVMTSLKETAIGSGA